MEISEKNKIKMPESLWGKFIDALLSVVFVAAKLIDTNIGDANLLLSEAKKMGVDFLKLQENVAQTDFTTRKKSVVKSSDIAQHAKHIAQSDFATSDTKKDIAKSYDIVRHFNYVAQYRTTLIYQVKNLVNIIFLLKNRPDTDEINTLLAYRNLLKFELSIYEFLNNNSAEESENNFQKSGGVAVSRKNRFNEAVSDKGKIKLGETKKNILKFMKAKGGLILNMDLFEKFNNISRRNVKRNMKELIDVGFVSRKTSGRKVYYSLK